MRKLETNKRDRNRGRNLPVLAWRQPRKPSLAGVHDECRYAACSSARSRSNALLRVLLIDAQTHLTVTGISALAAWLDHSHQGGSP